MNFMMFYNIGMDKNQYINQGRVEKSDLLSAVLSNLTVIIQLVALGAVGLSNVLELGSLFVFKELVSIANFIILFLSFALIGVYIFYKSNRDYDFSQPEKKGIFRQINQALFGTNLKTPLSKKGEKSFLVTLFIITVVSAFLFLFATYNVKSFSEYVANFGFIQIISYVLFLTCGSVLIFVWIRDQFDKKNQFIGTDFIPNLRGTLIEYGIVITPTVIILQNISLSNSNHAVKIKVQDYERYLITNFDGKNLLAEISEEEYQSILNPKKDT